MGSLRMARSVAGRGEEVKCGAGWLLTSSPSFDTLYANKGETVQTHLRTTTFIMTITLTGMRRCGRAGLVAGGGA